MSIVQRDLRFLIKEVLNHLECRDFKHNKEDLEELLIMTAATESRGGEYLKQTTGPACGIFQMEPATEKDCFENWLAYKLDLLKKIELLKAPFGHNLHFNLAYQTAMAAVRLTRTKNPVPSRKDTKALAEHYKKYYNTPSGKNTVEKAIEDYTWYTTRK